MPRNDLFFDAAVKKLKAPQLNLILVFFILPPSICDALLAGLMLVSVPFLLYYYWLLFWLAGLVITISWLITAAAAVFFWFYSLVWLFD
jgi:hypothetical protein